MKPDWDKLAAEFKGHASILIADVDCTTGGKALCNEIGVRGYPTIKHGDPNDLQDYKGGRTFADMKKFADELGPQCSPANVDLCSDDQKKQIQSFQALSSDEREKMVKEKESAIETLESDFKKFVEDLQSKYTAAQKKKDDDAAELRSGGLGLLKAVHAHAKREKKEL